MEDYKKRFQEIQEAFKTRETEEERNKRLLIKDLREVADGIESGRYQISHSNLQSLAAKLIQIQEQLPTIVSDQPILEEEDWER